jgi:nucleoside-diphosphate kinase
MAKERTLAIIKPDAVSRGLAGEILARIHQAGLDIIAIESLRMTKTEAEGFYEVHRGKPFFDELATFMSSGKVVVMALEAENAISRWRELMGATDPAKAAEGTLRRQFGTSIQNNCTHGSDAPTTAAFEITYFFSGRRLA